MLVIACMCKAVPAPRIEKWSTLRTLLRDGRVHRTPCPSPEACYDPDPTHSHYGPTPAGILAIACTQAARGVH
jgi:hypothetical protein